MLHDAVTSVVGSFSSDLGMLDDAPPPTRRFDAVGLASALARMEALESSDDAETLEARAPQIPDDVPSPLGDDHERGTGVGAPLPSSRGREMNDETLTLRALGFED